MTLMTKEELLAELTYHSYLALRPSPIEGIGVFALRDIPKGCREMFSKPSPDDKWITVSGEEVGALPAHAQWLLKIAVSSMKITISFPPMVSKK
jgi:hypothetical protein